MHASVPEPTCTPTYVDLKIPPAPELPESLQKHALLVHCSEQIFCKTPRSVPSALFGRMETPGCPAPSGTGLGVVETVHVLETQLSAFSHHSGAVGVAHCSALYLVGAVYVFD